VVRARLSPLLHWQVPEYHVENFGCRTSQADGDAISAALDALGAVQSSGVAQADVVVVNTCTVTADADRDARAYIRRIQRANPKSRIVVTGCYAQRAPQEIAELPGVFAVVGNSHKNEVARIAMAQGLSHLWPTAGPSTSSVRRGDSDSGRDDNFRFGGGFVPLASLDSQAKPEPQAAFLLTGDIFAHTDFQLPSLPGSVVHRGGEATGASRRTRPSLKIQDGCGNRCTFCVIPSTRGNSRSLPREQVLESIRDFADAGGTELVISGINLGRWGRDLLPQCQLEELLAEIFETTTLPRLRISSIEPMDWTEGLIGLFARWGGGECPRLARHAHVPLQSGSDAVLRRMHRRYRPWHYAERVEKIRGVSPDAAIGADVMVGFPGETDTEFQENYDFIAALPFTYLHLFPFSARPGTAAWQLQREHTVSGAAVKERMAALRTLIDQKNLAFRAGFVGRRLSAVTLNSSETVAAAGHSSALTDNFLPVELDGIYPPNTLVQIEITGLAATGVVGTVAKRENG
jgi:threonylcarbamoyladenosine tRNA methylthiotransferase MtaB